MLGTLAPTMHVEGSFTPPGGEKVSDAALVGTIALLDGESAFVKLIGPADEVNGAIAEFMAFCRSMR